MAATPLFSPYNLREPGFVLFGLVHYRVLVRIRSFPADEHQVLGTSRNLQGIGVGIRQNQQLSGGGCQGTAVYKYGGGDSAHLFGAVRQYPGTSFPPR